MRSSYCLLLALLLAACVHKARPDGAEPPVQPVPKRHENVETGTGDLQGAGNAQPEAGPLAVAELCEDPLNADPNTGNVRPGRCPLCPPRVCPEDCIAVEASALDLQHGCWREPIVVDCVRRGHYVFGDSIGCYVEVSTGIVHQTANESLGNHPLFRKCPPEERRLDGRFWRSKACP